MSKNISRLTVLFSVVTIIIGLVFSIPAFAVPDDAIESQHIKEADGITGQDTNTGSGVKTGHIQDGAVTSDKIGFYKNVIIVAPSGGDFTDPIAAMNFITDASANNPYLVKIMPGVYDVGVDEFIVKSFVDVEGSGKNITVITGSGPQIDGAKQFISLSGNAEIRHLTISHTFLPLSGVTLQVDSQSEEASISHVRIISPTRAIMIIMSSSVKVRDVTIDVASSGYPYPAAVYNYRYSTLSIENTKIRVDGTGGYSAYGLSNSFNSNMSATNIDVNVSGAQHTNYGVFHDFYSTTTLRQVNAEARGLNSHGLHVHIYAFGINVYQSNFYGENYSLYKETSSKRVNAAGTQFNGAINYSTSNYFVSCFDGNFIPL